MRASEERRFTRIGRTDDVDSFAILESEHAATGRSRDLTGGLFVIKAQVQVQLVSKNITITEDAYERLKRFKREDESFSDVIKRLTNSKADPMDFVGKWTGSGIAEAFEAARDQFEEDAEERYRELSRQ